jgi:hypothetical protein
METKIGDILAIKTTGEIVYVLTDEDDSQYKEDGFSGHYVEVKVRRPILSENGIAHEVAIFRSNELETVEEYVQREATMQTYKIKAQKNILEKAIRELEEAEREEANKKSRKAPLSIVN